MPIGMSPSWPLRPWGRQGEGHVSGSGHGISANRNILMYNIGLLPNSKIGKMGIIWIVMNRSFWY